MKGDLFMNIKDYMKLSYDFVIRQITDESGAYFYATVLELPGCQSTGETFQEAYEGILEAMEGWIEAKLENGFTVPMPIDTGGYSGKFVVRMPKSLHGRLAMEAEKEGVSLNQYALYKLAQ